MPKVVKAAKPAPVKLKAYTFDEVMVEMHKKREAERARVAAMTEEEHKAYLVELSEKQKRAEEILQKLRGKRGFREYRIG